MNKWIANLIANATKNMMEQKDERYILFLRLHDNLEKHAYGHRTGFLVSATLKQVWVLALEHD